MIHNFIIKKKPILKGYSLEVFKNLDDKNEAAIDSKYKSLMEDIAFANDVNEATEMVLSLKKFMDKKTQTRIAEKLMERTDKLKTRFSNDDLALIKDTIKRNFISNEESKNK